MSEPPKRNIMDALIKLGLEAAMNKPAFAQEMHEAQKKKLLKIANAKMPGRKEDSESKLAPPLQYILGSANEELENLLLQWQTSRQKTCKCWKGRSLEGLPTELSTMQLVKCAPQPLKKMKTTPKKAIGATVAKKVAMKRPHKKRIHKTAGEQQPTNSAPIAASQPNNSPPAVKNKMLRKLRKTAEPVITKNAKDPPSANGFKIKTQKVKKTGARGHFRSVIDLVKHPLKQHKNMSLPNTSKHFRAQKVAMKSGTTNAELNQQSRKLRSDVMSSGKNICGRKAANAANGILATKRGRPSVANRSRALVKQPRVAKSKGIKISRTLKNLKALLQEPSKTGLISNLKPLYVNKNFGRPAIKPEPFVERPATEPPAVGRPGVRRRAFASTALSKADQLGPTKRKQVPDDRA